MSNNDFLFAETSKSSNGNNGLANMGFQLKVTGALLTLIGFVIVTFSSYPVGLGFVILGCLALVGKQLVSYEFSNALLRTVGIISLILGVFAVLSSWYFTAVCLFLFSLSFLARDLSRIFSRIFSRNK